MEIYRLDPGVSEISIMRRVRRAGARCIRLIPGNVVKTLIVDRQVDCFGLEKDWSAPRRYGAREEGSVMW